MSARARQCAEDEPPRRLSQMEKVKEYIDSLGDRSWVTEEAIDHFDSREDFWHRGQKERLLRSAMGDYLNGLRRRLPKLDSASGEATERFPVLRFPEDVDDRAPSEEVKPRWEAPSPKKRTASDYAQKIHYFWGQGDHAHAEARRLLTVGLKELPAKEAKKLGKEFANHPVWQMGFPGETGQE